MSLADLEAELTDFRQRCVSGLLTGALPDCFLQVFNALPDRPLEHVLRFLPAKQVVKMRGVSRKWNQLIKKASKSMPKKGHDDAVVIKINGDGHLSFEWVDQVNGWTRKTTQIGVGAPLSELLRFIRIDGTIFFGDGLSATDDVLEQMTKAWLTIRPQRLVFSGELKGTSADSLRAFLTKVEPFVRLLHFQNATIPDDLLSDRVVAAAGRLDGLLVLPMSWGPDPPVVNIGDETLASMGSWNKMPSYIFFRGCSGGTAAGIRTFVENWIKYEGAIVDEELHTDGANVWGDEKLCELTFYQCPNITAEAVEETCGDLLKKEKCPSIDWSGGDQQGEDRFTIAFGASRRRLCIQFHDASRKHSLEQPMLQFHFNDGDSFDLDQEDDLDDPDMYDFEDDYDPEDGVDYDDYDEDTDLD